MCSGIGLLNSVYFSFPYGTFPMEGEMNPFIGRICFSLKAVAISKVSSSGKRLLSGLFCRIGKGLVKESS